MEIKTYLELWVALSPGQVDVWSSFCFEENSSGIETIDDTESVLQMRVFFENQNIHTIRQLPDKFSKQYPNSGQSIQLLKLEERPYEDWQSAWKQYFLPVNIGQSFTVCPPWKLKEVPNKKTPIIIDPGQGFGTGNHPSSILALEVLEQYILHSEALPKSMVDVGTGSGILAFAAAFLGVPSIHGVDIDKAAIHDVTKNRKLNHLEHAVQVVIGGPACLKKKYSIVISNMLLTELLHVKKELIGLVDTMGVLICSGFLEKQWPELRDAFEQLGMISKHIFQKEEWRAVIMQHDSPSLEQTMPSD
ncbi:MAG: 50S ribosomal protein L11 methyltransferase [SAR324 cluster bacterium]|nr:50S ribosomal protein L11 methyltransferase [SAR324 cluster bacterium]